MLVKRPTQGNNNFINVSNYLNYILNYIVEELSRRGNFGKQKKCPQLELAAYGNV